MRFLDKLINFKWVGSSVKFSENWHKSKIDLKSNWEIWHKIRLQLKLSESYIKMAKVYTTFQIGSQGFDFFTQSSKILKSF